MFLLILDLRDTLLMFLIDIQGSDQTLAVIDMDLLQSFGILLF